MLPRNQISQKFWIVNPRKYAVILRVCCNREVNFINVTGFVCVCVNLLLNAFFVICNRLTNTSENASFFCFPQQAHKYEVQVKKRSQTHRCYGFHRIPESRLFVDTLSVPSLGLQAYLEISLEVLVLAKTHPVQLRRYGKLKQEDQEYTDDFRSGNFLFCYRGIPAFRIQSQQIFYGVPTVGAIKTKWKSNFKFSGVTFCNSFLSGIFAPKIPMYTAANPNIPAMLEFSNPENIQWF